MEYYKRIQTILAALESSREDLLPWMSKKSRAYLGNKVTDIHKVKITYQLNKDKDIHDGKKHRLMINIPLSILNPAYIAYDRLKANGFSDYMSVNRDSVTLFYEDIPDFADIKHKGETF